MMFGLRKSYLKMEAMRRFDDKDFLIYENILPEVKAREEADSIKNLQIFFQRCAKVKNAGNREKMQL